MKNLPFLPAKFFLKILFLNLHKRRAEDWIWVFKKKPAWIPAVIASKNPQR